MSLSADMLSTQLPTFDILDSFGDLHLNSTPSPTVPTTTTRAMPIRTFTRLARGLPNNSSSSNAFASNSLFTTTTSPVNKPTQVDSISRKDLDHSESANTSTIKSTSTDSSSTGLRRFRPCLPSLASQDSALLENRTARPCPTFTRLSKLPHNTGCYNNTNSDTISNINSNDSNNSFIINSSSSSCPPNKYASTTYPSKGNVSSNTVNSSSSTARAAALSLSLSLSLSPPPSAAPSLSSASSSCSSSSSSSSPPPSRFIFPTDDCNDWWLGLSLDETPEEERQGIGSAAGSSLRSGSGSYRLSSAYPLPSTNNTESPSPVGSQAMSRHDLERGNTLPAAGGPEDMGQDGNGIIQAATTAGARALMAPERQPSLKTMPRTTHLLNRTRTPSPPPILTGFCSISNNPIKCSGEASPQDFLGEADLPYPLPSTLQERQARQRKRVEQLRQLKVREEFEARENRRRVRRRGASFSAGMYTCPSSPSSASSLFSSTPHSALSLSSPAPGSSSPSLSRSLSVSFPSSWVNNHQTRHGHHLRRSPSSPAKSIGGSVGFGVNGSGVSPRKPRLCVGFDLRRTKVFEYEVGEEWTPCSSQASSPAGSCNIERQEYFSFRD